MYEYILDAGEQYEPWMETSIFSNELLTEEEFQEVIENAQAKCGWNNDWNGVARKIVEMDERFFFSERAFTAIIKYSDDNKLSGIYEH